MSNSFSFVQRYISGVRNKIINVGIRKQKHFYYDSLLPENNFCIAEQVERTHWGSGLNNILSLDEDDIKYLADKYYGKLLDEMKNKVETITTEYTELINDFDSLENGK